MKEFDIAVLGGGPGGYLAAERAGEAGKKVVLIEERALGGVCLNEGCIPTKSFLYCAKVFDYTKHAKAYGVSVQGASIDHSAVLERKNKVVKTLVSGVSMKMKKCGVKVINSAGKINGKQGERFVIETEKESVLAKNVIIATGSMPILPPITGLKEAIDSGVALTSREILNLTEIPKSLVVVGGGVIGLEMAAYFNSVGSDVTVIEMMDKIAGATDDDISDVLLKNYIDKGIKFELGHKVTSFEGGTVYYEDNEKKSITAEKILVCIGRTPTIKNIGLESIGVETERGAAVTDDYMRTNIPGVYAVGDVNGKYMLAHTAYREAEVAVNHILGKRDFMRYSAIPSVIYTTPEVACVGETEQTAKEKGYEVKEVKLPMMYSGRYVAETTRQDGICKLVIDTKYDRLLGVHLIGSYASEMIYGAALMIETELKIDDLKELVFPHPTVCEVIREALFEV